MKLKGVLYQIKMDVFWNAFNIISKTILAWSISNSYNLLKEELTLCLDVEFQKFCERHEIDIGINDVISKRIHPRTVELRKTCLYLIKTIIVLFGRKIKETFDLKGFKKKRPI